MPKRKHDDDACEDVDPPQKVKRKGTPEPPQTVKRNGTPEPPQKRNCTPEPKQVRLDPGSGARRQSTKGTPPFAFPMSLKGGLSASVKPTRLPTDFDDQVVQRQQRQEGIKQVAQKGFDTLLKKWSMPERKSAVEQIYEWYINEKGNVRTPLVVSGPSQQGKTTLVNDFCRLCCPHNAVFYLNNSTRTHIEAGAGSLSEGGSSSSTSSPYTLLGRKLSGLSGSDAPADVNHFTFPDVQAQLRRLFTRERNKDPTDGTTLLDAPFIIIFDELRDATFFANVSTLWRQFNSIFIPIFINPPCIFEATKGSILKTPNVVVDLKPYTAEAKLQIIEQTVSADRLFLQSIRPFINDNTWELSELLSKAKAAFRRCGTIPLSRETPTLSSNPMKTAVEDTIKEIFQSSPSWDSENGVAFASRATSIGILSAYIASVNPKDSDKVVQLNGAEKFQITKNKVLRSSGLMVGKARDDLMVRQSQVVHRNRIQAFFNLFCPMAPNMENVSYDLAWQTVAQTLQSELGICDVRGDKWFSYIQGEAMKACIHLGLDSTFIREHVVKPPPTG